MGQRTIDTILRVQGEGDYKTALKNCSAEMKVMKSELDKVTSEFRTNANSMEALTAKGDVLNRMYETQEQKVELLRGSMKKAQDTREAEEKTVADLRQQYYEAKAALSAYGDEVDKTSVEYQEQKAQVDKLRDAVIQHQAKLDASTKSYSYYATQLNKAEVELNDLEDKLEENGRLMEEAKQSADGCATSIDRYGDAVKNAGDGTGETTSAVEVMASAMVASGVQQKVEDLAAAMMECSEAAQEFEVSLAQVGTISDESVVSAKAIREGVLELSTDLRKDANEVAEAVYNALSAGVETADALEFTAQSSQLATAGFTDMSTSVDVLTTILNAYKLESSQTEKVASTLVKTQDLGKVTVDQLGKVIGRVIPSAAAYGVNLDNIATAYANMTASGINAENTTTYLSTMMDELADSGSTVAGILQEKTRKSFAELMDEGKSLGDVLDILGASVGYNNTAFSNLWSSSTAAKGAISLFNGSADAFNATLDKMSNSSGTVAKNYKKMTDISEYSSQRLEVAVSNLKIAVGDQLNPVLDELREGGAGVLEKVTDTVNKSPALVSAISGVVTALGLLAGGVSALMIAKSAAAAMQALNISLAANPAVLITTAVVGLAVALGTYIAQIETTRDRVDALTESARGLSETVAAGNTSFEDTVVSTEAAAATVEQYIDRLEALEAQGLNTEAQQQEYSMTLDKINTLMPGINAELDAQTNLVQGGTDALRQQAAAWKANAIAEAAYTRYKDTVAAMADAEYELALNQAKLSMAEKDNQTIKGRLAQVTKELSEAQDRLNNLTVVGGSYLGATSKEQIEAQRRIAELEAEYQSLSSQMVEVNTKEGVLKQAIEEGTQAIADAETEVQAATQAYESMAGSLETASEETVAATEEMSSAVDEAAQQIQEAYENLYASAKDSLDKQIGLFDDLSGKCEISAEKMIENLKSQQKAFDDYATNIQLAMERGIDIGLVQKLSDGSVESMQILAELVVATDEQITQLNEVFDQKNVAAENAGATMAALNLAYAKGLKALSEGWFENWKEVGKNAAEGLISGMESKKPAVNKASSSLAESSINAYKTASKINSPSKRWQELAEWDVAAPLMVYKQAIPKMEASARALSDAGYLGSIRSKQAAIPSLAAMASTATVGSDNTQLLQLLQQILAGIHAGKKLVLYPDVLIGETAEGFDTVLGQRKILADRGAT